jgi:hypothetical protein
LKKKIANLFHMCAEMIRVEFVFMSSFATSRGGVKGTNFGLIGGGGLAVFAPA